MRLFWQISIVLTLTLACKRPTGSDYPQSDFTSETSEAESKDCSPKQNDAKSETGRDGWQQKDGNSYGLAGDVTYLGDIMPLIKDNCKSCHSTYMEFERVMSVRYDMVTQIEARLMPLDLIKDLKVTTNSKKTRELEGRLDHLTRMFKAWQDNNFKKGQMGTNSQNSGQNADSLDKGDWQQKGDGKAEQVSAPQSNESC
jgi:hypothetical protein